MYYTEFEVKHGNFLFIIDDDNRITLMPMHGQANRHNDFINASYIDVSR